MNAVRAEANGNEPDDRTDEEHDDPDRARKDVGENHEQGEDTDTEFGMIDPADSPQIPVADDEDEDEPDRSGDSDGRKEHRQVQRDVGAFDGDEHARSGCAQSHECEQREDRVWLYTVLRRITRFVYDYNMIMSDLFDAIKLYASIQ